MPRPLTPSSSGTVSYLWLHAIKKHGSIGGLKEHAPSQTFRQPTARRVCSATGFQQARYYLPFLDLRGSDASTLRTSDWEIPNCLAMRKGVIPALKVARTALTWPCVNATLGSSGCRRSGVVVDRCAALCSSGLSV